MDSFRKHVYKIKSVYDTLVHMAIIANKYKFTIYQPLKKISGKKILKDRMKMHEFIFLFCRGRYRNEEGEILLRPDLFLKVGGDCDDFSIFIASYLLLFNVPSSNIFFSVYDNKHVFVKCWDNVLKEVIIFDCLPDREFNKSYYKNGLTTDYNLKRLLNDSKGVHFSG